jgi:hypothetical protein
MTRPFMGANGRAPGKRKNSSLCSINPGLGFELHVVAHSTSGRAQTAPAAKIARAWTTRSRAPRFP